MEMLRVTAKNHLDRQECSLGILWVFLEETREQLEVGEASVIGVELGWMRDAS